MSGFWFNFDGGDSLQPLLPLQVYDHRYKAVVDGVETDSLMEIDPSRRVVTFRMGNGSKEILEVHDFKNASSLSRKHFRHAGYGGGGGGGGVHIVTFSHSCSNPVFVFLTLQNSVS